MVQVNNRKGSNVSYINHDVSVDQRKFYVDELIKARDEGVRDLFDEQLGYWWFIC